MADQNASRGLENRHNPLQPRETPPLPDIVRRNSDEQRNNGGSSTLLGSERKPKPSDKWGIGKMKEIIGIGPQTQDRPGTEVKPWALKRADLTVRSSGIAELNSQSVNENGNLQRKYEELSQRFKVEIDPLLKEFDKIDNKLQSRSNKVQERFDEVHEQLHDLSRTAHKGAREFQELSEQLRELGGQLQKFNNTFSENNGKIQSINNDTQKFSGEIRASRSITFNRSLIQSNDKLIQSNNKLIETNESRIKDTQGYRYKIDQFQQRITETEPRPQDYDRVSSQSQGNSHIESDMTRDLDNTHTSIEQALDEHAKRFQEYQKYRKEQFDPHCKTVDGNPRFDGNVEETKTKLWEFKKSFGNDNSKLFYKVKRELTAIKKNLQTSSSYLDREVIDRLNATNDSLIKRTESQIEANNRTLEQMEADKKKYFPNREYDLGNHFGL